MPGRDRTTGPPDPYEHGFEVAQRRRLDLSDVPDLPADVGGRRRPPRVGWRVLAGALGVVVLLAVGRAVTARNATGLKADCSRTQLAVAESSVVSRGTSLLHWAATAPAGTRYVVAIDAAALTVTGGAVVRADPAVTGTSAQVSPVQTMARGCLGHGQFGVLLPAGRYPVTLFRLDGDRATAVAVRTVRVTSS